MYVTKECHYIRDKNGYYFAYHIVFAFKSFSIVLYYNFAL